MFYGTWHCQYVKQLLGQGHKTQHTKHHTRHIHKNKQKIGSSVTFDMCATKRNYPV